MVVGFDEKSAERISRAVKKVEKMPQQQTPFRKRHKTRGRGGSQLNSAKIKSGTGDSYTADIYSNIDKDPDEDDQTLKILQIDSGETIPVDTILPCWEQDWGVEGSEETYWTADIARWY